MARTLVLLILVASACSDNDPKGGPGPDNEDSSLTIFDVWRNLGDGLHASPDHLPARADALVQGGDPEALFLFVRDQITTVPPVFDGFDNAHSATRWGTRATVRGGAGTPREKADLLVELYERAGLEATVRSGAPDPARVDPAAMLATRNQAFAPDFDASDLGEWASVLGYDAVPPSPSIIDADGSETAALVTTLESFFPSETATFDVTLPSSLPVVRVDVGGTPTYANPSVPGAPFGDAMTTSEPTSTGNAASLPTVRVRLEGARSDDPFNRFTLVERSWNAADVVGRRINLGFAPALDLAQLPAVTIGDVSLFIPAITVAGADLDPANDLGEVGKPFNLGGDLYEVSDTGEVTVNGDSLGSGASDPTALASVTSLGMTIQPRAFERISLRVSATNASGDRVPGLGADAFRVTEEGAPVAFTLRQNTAPPPRVVLLVDASTSMPPEYLGTGAVTFANQIVAALYAEHPNAWLKIGTVFFGADFASNSWATTLVDAQAQADWLETAFGGSEIWQALAEANEERPTVIILVSDGDATDTLEPEYETAIAVGVPIATVGVGTVNTAITAQIAELSGGTSVTAGDTSTAVDAALAEIDRRSVQDYILTYRAPTEGSATRTAAISIDSGRVSTEGDYDVPADPASPPALSGLYLTIDVGSRDVTRTIAGLDRGFYGWRSGWTRRPAWNHSPRRSNPLTRRPCGWRSPQDSV